MHVFFKKGISKSAKKSNISPIQAQRVSKALNAIQSVPSKQLLTLPQVHKIKAPNRNDMYVYRVDMRQRIVFSVENEQIIIHTIVDTNDIK